MECVEPDGLTLSLPLAAESSIDSTGTGKPPMNNDEVSTIIGRAKRVEHLLRGYLG